jgi:hypothetical protein
MRTYRCAVCRLAGMVTGSALRQLAAVASRSRRWRRALLPGGQNAVSRGVSRIRCADQSFSRSRESLPFGHSSIADFAIRQLWFPRYQLPLSTMMPIPDLRVCQLRGASNFR